jgi:hypothetical protein
MKTLGYLASIAVLLAACAPQTGSGVNTATIQGKPAFYPSQIGLDWVYLPQRSPTSDPPYRLSILGPGSFGGQPAIRYRFSGRGQERSYFRRIGSNGIQLLGFEETVTSSVVRFTPPMQEYPAEATMNVGARWGGTSRVESEIIAGGRVTRLADSSITYNYEVVGRTNVAVGAGSFEALRISLRIKPAQGELEVYEIWYVPYVGEVRTREGLLLVGRNFN